MQPQLPNRVEENFGQFTGRVWLLPKLLKWWERGDERLFLLTGDPGTGKSMILGWLSRFGPKPEDPIAQAQLASLRNLVKAAHFSQASSRNITPQAFAESIANQLTGTVNGFGDALAATLADRVNVIGTARAGTAASGSSLTGVAIGRIDLGTLGDELSFDRAFTQPLKKLYESGHSEPILLLVDALDEAQTYTGVTLPDLLSRLDDLPAQVRILATTRKEPRVLKFFRRIEPFDLIEDAAPDVDDVRTYAEGRLAKLTAVEEDKRSDFAFRLGKQADGVFLYAVMVLEELIDRPPADFPDLDTYPLPDRLSGLYHQFLTRELGKNDQLWSDRYRPLLGLIAVAQGDGLTALQLKDIIDRDIDETQDTLRRCKQYLSGELPDGPFRPFHKSFADFLLEDEDNPDYHIDVQSMHGRIAKHYWSQYHDGWSKCDDYGLASLAVHLNQGQQFDRLAKLINQEWMQARIARAGRSNEGFIADLDLAWRAALREREDAETAIVKSVRYALIRASFSSVSVNYPPLLVARALEDGLWTPERVFGLADRLRGHAAVDLWSAVLATGRLASKDTNRAAGLAIGAAQAISDPSQRVPALTKLANILGGEARSIAVREALGATKQVVTPGDRVDAVVGLAPFLAGEEKSKALREALDWVPEIRFSFVPADDSSYAGGQALTRLAPELTANLALSALEIGNTIADPYERAVAKTALAPRLPTATREMVVSDLLDNVKRSLEMARSQLSQQTANARRSSEVSQVPAEDSVDSKDRVLPLSPQLLCSLAPLINADEKDRLFRDFLSLLSRSTPKTIWSSLDEIAPILTHELALLGVEIGRQIEDASARAQLFAVLATALCKEDKQGLLLETVETLRDAEPIDRAMGLAAWIRHAENPAKQVLVQDVLTAALELVPRTFNVYTTAKLRAPLEATLPHLSEDDLESALNLALLPGLAAAREEILELLAPKLRGELLRRALTKVGEIEDQGSRVVAMGAIAGQMSGKAKAETLTYALAAAMQIRIPYQRAKALSKLGYLLDGAEKERALTEGLLEVKDSSVFPTVALDMLAPHLTGKLIAQGLEVARQLSDGIRPSEALVTKGLSIMISRLSGDVKQELIEEVLSSLGNSDHSHNWDDVLVRLVPNLDGELLKRSWVEARKLDDGEGKAKSLIEIARRLCEQDRKEALDESLAAARTIARPVDRIATMVDLSEVLEEDRKNGVIEEALAMALEVEEEYGDEGERAAALSVLVRVLNAGEKRRVLPMALDLIEQSGAWRQAQVLEMLAPQLDGHLLDRAARLAESIADSEERARALASVAARSIQETENGAAQAEVLCRIGDWLRSLKEIPRGQMLHFCTQSLFEQKILSQGALGEIAQCIREISDEWRFNLV